MKTGTRFEDTRSTSDGYVYTDYSGLSEEAADELAMAQVKDYVESLGMGLDELTTELLGCEPSLLRGYLRLVGIAGRPATAYLRYIDLRRKS